MTFEKSITKHFMLSIFAFLVGMLNVSIAGIFGGYYCSVAAILVVLSTIYAYDLFDKKLNIRNNIIDIFFVAIVCFLNIIFFIVNDIFNVSVYTKNVFNFWSISVIISQVVSIIALVYTLAIFAINNTKGKVELVEDQIKEKSIEDPIVESVEKKDVNEEKEIRVISQNKQKKDAPFMEEEK